jgi:hypothetical protein
MKKNDQTISLSLVSHTNVGKTTLARTLLSRNVGVVRDEPHVTDSADRFPLIETPEGDVLSLWDTPGFGDSARLARRLQQSDKPIGWFVSQIWDRLTDRALWSSQQAVRNVRDEADVVLYLVNAAENPEDAGYVESEMHILEWIGKPIIVLLNQMGPPSGPQDEAAEIERWRSHLSYAPAVRQVLALDAFARCWVQEGALLKEVAKLIPEAKVPAFARLHRAWQTQRRAAFDAAMQLLAERLARAALDRERVPHGGIKGRLREVGSVLGVTRDKEDTAKQAAMRHLAERLDADIRDSTNQLIELHGLEGNASSDVLTRLADHYAVTKQVNEGRAAVVGGLVTGALAGLKADVISGGFTLGGGMIAGGVIGALGAAGLARGYNMVRGTETVTVTWTDDVMNRLVSSSLLAYLAVAHYGRGRGQWAQSEHPAFWESTVREVLVQQSDNFNHFWRRRHTYKLEALTEAIRTELTLAAERILIRLYPQAVSAAAIGTETARLNAETRADAERLRLLREAEAREAEAREAAERSERGDDSDDDGDREQDAAPEASAAVDDDAPGSVAPPTKGRDAGSAGTSRSSIAAFAAPIPATDAGAPATTVSAHPVDAVAPSSSNSSPPSAASSTTASSSPTASTASSMATAAATTAATAMATASTASASTTPVTLMSSPPLPLNETLATATSATAPDTPETDGALDSRGVSGRLAGNPRALKRASRSVRRRRHRASLDKSDDLGNTPVPRATH